jgi:exopolyphosphatase/guanosine-5'-triphosphate,3'-diphosphate pyrophosphatase
MNRRATNLAAIDVGTNSIHLIVAKVHPVAGRFTVLHKEKEVVRLGAGSTDMKYLTQRAMAKSIHTLRRFKMVADSLRAPVRAVATSAVREALNQDDFLRRVKAETGIKLEITSGFEEARLIHLGVLQALPVFKKRHLMVDIGGGSSEFLVGYQRRILYNNSLKIGAVRLTQRFFASGKKSTRAVRECEKFVRGMLNPIRRSVREHDIDLTVGTSGTIANLANIIRCRRGSDNETSLNGFAFKREELVESVEEIVAAEDVEARLDIEGLDPARADIILAGAIILREVFRELGVKEMMVSEYALREGIILDTLEHFHSGRRIKHFHDLRYSNVLHLAESLHYEKGHSHQVARLALRIFDQTIPLHKLGDQEREFLEAAALLHEVGLFVSHAQHHRHSYYLVRNSELLGFTENEKEMIANIARYHRKSHPKTKHEGFSKLNADDQEVVRRLSAILRIADGLDRTHSEVVRDIRCRISGRTVHFAIRRSRKSSVELELWGAERKKLLFEESLRVHAKFMASR